MSDVTERHRDKAEIIALYLYSSGDFWDKFSQEFRMTHMAIQKDWWVDLFTTPIAEKLAALEGDPPEKTIVFKGPNTPLGRKEIDQLRQEIEASKKQLALERKVNPDWFKIVFQGAELAGDPPEGLEEAVRKAFKLNLMNMRTCEKSIQAIIAAVQRFCWKPDDQLEAAHDDLLNDNHKLQAEVQEHRNHVAKIMSSSHIEARRHMDARRELHAKVDALEKQVEELQEEREGAYKHGYEDAGGSR